MVNTTPFAITSPRAATRRRSRGLPRLRRHRLGVEHRRIRTGGAVRLPAPARLRPSAARRQHSRPLSRLHAGRVQHLATRGQPPARLLSRQERPAAPARRLACKRYVDEFLSDSADLRFRDGGLLFYGPPGVGKTHLAAAVLRELILNYRCRGRFVDVTSFTQDLQSTIDPDAPFSRNELLQPIESAEVLVVDELGAQSLRPWAADVLYDLINRRYARRLPTLFTTNYRLDDAAGAPNRSPPIARSPASRAATADSSRPGARCSGAPGSCRDASPAMLVSRLWEMAQVIEPRRGQGLSAWRSASHQHWREGRRGRLLSSLVLAIAATLRRRRHRGEVERRSPALPCRRPIAAPRDRSSSASVSRPISSRVSIPCCERVWVEHGGTRRSIDGGFEVTPGGEAKKPIYKLQAGCARRTRIRRGCWRARSNARPARRRR